MFGSVKLSVFLNKDNKMKNNNDSQISGILVIYVRLGTTV